MSLKIIGIGSFLPVKSISNHELSRIFATSDEWIVSRTGIKQRYFSDIEVDEMGALAAGDALKNASMNKSTIDYIIVCSCTNNQAFPSIANKIQKRLNIESIPSIDINAACSGFIYALEIASGLISAGKKTILIVAAEKMSSLLTMQDRSVDVLFGDGASAVLVQKTSSQDRIFEIITGVDPEYCGILKTLETIERQRSISMDGGKVYKYAVQKMTELSLRIMNKANLSYQDIDYFIPHQANLRIIESVAEKLNLEKEKVVTTVESHANTSSASIPLAMYDLFSQKKLANKKILTVAVGAGMSFGAAIFDISV
ncbi:MAG: beta-ketoacyl-ACP synthase 3 [Rickettsiaceae bacterium]|nr:beta-ketoacyl-ACP synthase 3 [Rickettsiaceae bacterium]